MPVKILFITSTRLGDAVLSTGLLAHLARTYPESEITVACGPLVEGLFTPAPNVARVLALRKEPRAGHWRKLWRACVGTKWDIVVDLRNSAVSRLLLSGKRHVWNNPPDELHKVEQNAHIMGLTDAPPAPELWFSDTVCKRAAELVPDGGPVLAVGPSANWIGKSWPAENFIELVERLTSETDGILPGARVAVIAAPGEEEPANKVLDSVPEDRRIDIIAKADPATVAAAIARCDFYVGNDSGLMHCAAATGVPTLGLFGPSKPHHYRPWGPRAAWVSTPETMEELLGGRPANIRECLMESLTIEAACAAASELWNKLSSDDGRKTG